MQQKVVFGNAQTEGESRGGWFIGHFITPTDDSRSTSNIEVKWAVHKAEECRSQWAINVDATTLSILIQGQFRVQFPEQEVLLSRAGDYVLWLPGVPHSWQAHSDSTILTIRYPSKPGDSVGIQITQ